jgi:mono/diheme cytochrome c family protein
MRNEDLGKIIAFIRSKPDEGETLPASEIRILGRLDMLGGQHPPEASIIDHDRPRREFDLNDPLQHGEYLALMACSECHGLDFKGPPGEEPGPGIPPDLVVASAYTPEAFAKLMRTGAPLDGRDLGLMGEVSRGRLVHFTDEEISAVHQFLIHRAQTMNE